MPQLIQIGKILENNNCSLNLDGDILLYFCPYKLSSIFSILIVTYKDKPKQT